MSTRVNNLAVTRLFSTGRFEHTKFSVSVEPGSLPPGQLMREIESIIADLNPVSPVDDYDLGRAREVASIAEMPPGSTFDKEWAADVLSRHEQWLGRRESAYARLDAMGATLAEETRES